MQGAKQRTKELLGNGVDNWEDLQQDEHRRRLEFDRRRWELSSLFAILGDELENLADACDNDEASADKELSAREVSTQEAPAEEAAAVIDERLWDPDIRGPATDKVHPDKEDEGEMITTDYNLRLPATEAGLGSHVNPDTATTAKQVHIRGVDDSEVDQEKPSRKEVVSIVDKVVQHGVLLNPTALKYERPPQMLTRDGLKEKLLVSLGKPDTRDPELREFPDRGVMAGQEGCRRKPQRLLQHRDSIEPKQRHEAGACTPPPRF